MFLIISVRVSYKNEYGICVPVRQRKVLAEFQIGKMQSLSQRSLVLVQG